MSDRQPFISVPIALLSADLSAHAKLAYVVLMRHAGQAGETAWPSLTLIAAEMSVTRPTALKALDELARTGLVARRRRGRGATAVYTVQEVKSVDFKAVEVNVVDTSEGHEVKHVDTCMCDEVKRVDFNGHKESTDFTPEVKHVDTRSKEFLPKADPLKIDPLKGSAAAAPRPALKNDGGSPRTREAFRSALGREPSAEEARTLAVLEQRAGGRGREHELIPAALDELARALASGDASGRPIKAPMAYLSRIVSQHLRDGTRPGEPLPGKEATPAKEPKPEEEPVYIDPSTGRPWNDEEHNARAWELWDEEQLELIRHYRDEAPPDWWWRLATEDMRQRLIGWADEHGEPIPDTWRRRAPERAALAGGVR